MNKDAFTQTACSMIQSMNVLGSKWKPVIIYRIATQEIRFSNLAEQITIISRKVLTDQLKELEEDGIVVRRAFNELPPRVEYSLTDKGIALLPILDALSKWNQKFGGGHGCQEQKAPAKKAAAKKRAGKIVT